MPIRDLFAILAVICFVVATIFDGPPYSKALPLGLVFLTIALVVGG